MKQTCFLRAFVERYCCSRLCYIIKHQGIGNNAIVLQCKKYSAKLNNRDVIVWSAKEDKKNIWQEEDRSKTISQDKKWKEKMKKLKREKRAAWLRHKKHEKQVTSKQKRGRGNREKIKEEKNKEEKCRNQYLNNMLGGLWVKTELWAPSYPPSWWFFSQSWIFTRGESTVESHQEMRGQKRGTS